MGQEKAPKRPLLEELEERRLFSAEAGLAPALVDLAATPSEPAPALHLEGEAAPISARAVAPALELVFVAGDLEDPAALVEDLVARRPDVVRFELIVIDPEDDGLAEIGSALATHRDVGAVHVLSHGNAEGVQLGGRWLDAEALAAASDSVAGWRSGLAPGADLLFYGCDLAAGEGGRALLAGLARLTGADVAASNDATGHASLGGDWDLEHRLGAVEHVPDAGVAAARWHGLLAAPVAADDAYAVDQNDTLDSSETWLDPDWTERRRLDFSNASRTENLVDFPVLISLDATRIDYANVQNAGEDLRFTDADGTLLAHEIERWDETGTSTVWVRVPQVDGSSDSDHVFMYYGNASAADGQNRAGVWGAGYESVYHLEGDPGAAPGGVIDSAGRIHATNQGSADAAGALAGGQDFTPAGAEHIALGNGLDLLRNTDAATLSAWVNSDNIVGSHEVVAISRGTGATVQSRAGFYVQNGSIGVFGRTLDNDSDWNWRTTTTAPITTGTWHHVTTVIDYASDSIQVFVDGVAQPMNAPASFIGVVTDDTAATTASIGAQDDGSSTFWDGRIDEVRVAEAARSADWVSAQHASMTDAFVSYRPPQTVAGVLGNDTDPDADPLTTLLVSGPSHARAFTLNADGTFSYTPEIGFRGVDSFSYKANDGGTDSNVATVVITVRPIFLAGTSLSGAPAPAPAPTSGLGIVTVHGKATAPDAVKTLSVAWKTASAAAPAVPLVAPMATAPIALEPPAPASEDAAARPRHASSQRLAAVSAAAPHVAEAETVPFGLQGADLQASLEGLRREMEKVGESRTFASAAMTGSAVALTAGALSWFLRGGYMLGSLLSVLPLWSRLDPITVLDAGEEETRKREQRQEDEQERRVGRLLDRRVEVPA